MRRDRGVTLIELLLAVSLFSLALVILVPTLLGGISVWQRDDQKTGTSHEMNIFFEKISNELETLVPFSAVPFEGKADSLLMTSVRRSAENPAGKQFSRIVYLFNNTAIFREEKDLAVLLQEQKTFEEEDRFREPWLDKVREFSLEYAYQKEKGNVEWRGEWQQDKTKPDIPFGIKMHLTVVGSDDQLVSAERILFLPDGLRKAYHELGK